MDNHSNAYLGTEPIGKLLIRLAVPTVTAQIINMLYNLVDRIYIGHLPENGDLALTGLGVCMPIIMIVSAFSAFAASGGAPRASIAMGQGDQEGANRLLGNCFTMQVCISLVLTTLLLLFNRPLLLAFGASENTIAYASGYMRIYALGTISVQLTLGMNAFITAQGFTNVSMQTVLIGALCNIVLDPILIFLLGMGVQGAALATILSQSISMVWVLLFLCGRRSILRLQRKYMIPSVKTLVPCLTLGLSTFVMQASESAVSICFNSSLLRYGGDVAVGSITILTSVKQFAMLPMQGLSQGAMPITSYNFGAGNKDRVRQSFFLLLRCILVYSMTLWALLMLFPTVFVRIFTNAPELVEFSARMLRVYVLVLGIFGAQMACQQTFVSIGNAKASITVAVLRKFILLIPLIFILPHFFADKTLAVYMAEPVADFCSVVFTVVLFTFQFRKALAGMDARPAAQD